MPRKEKEQQQQAPVTFVDLNYPVTFVDLNYVERNIKIGDESVCVEFGRVTVSDPALIEALDAMYGFVREGK